MPPESLTQSDDLGGFLFIALVIAVLAFWRRWEGRQWGKVAAMVIKPLRQIK